MITKNVVSNEIALKVAKLGMAKYNEALDKLALN